MPTSSLLTGFSQSAKIVSHRQTAYLTGSRAPLMDPLRLSSFHLPSSLSPVIVTSNVHLSPSTSISPVSVSPLNFRFVNSNWPGSPSAVPVSLPSCTLKIAIHSAGPLSGVSVTHFHRPSTALVAAMRSPHANKISPATDATPVVRLILCLLETWKDFHF